MRLDAEPVKHELRRMLGEIEIEMGLRGLSPQLDPHGLGFDVVQDDAGLAVKVKATTGETLTRNIAWERIFDLLPILRQASGTRH